MFNNVKLGIAPIGWTNDDMPELGGDLTFEQMISEAALAGFSGTEVGGKFPSDSEVLNKALDLRGFKLCYHHHMETVVQETERLLDHTDPRYVYLCFDTGHFTIPGDGCVDYPSVFAALKEAHYEGWFIVEAEQDPGKANPLEYAKKAREYIWRTAAI